MASRSSVMDISAADNSSLASITLNNACLIVPHLLSTDMTALTATCHGLRTLFNSDILWSEWIRTHCNPLHLQLPGSRKELARRIMNSHIGAERLYIVWGDKPEYWQLVDSKEESHFAKIAELQSVCWLQIEGLFKNVNAGTYELIWRIELPSVSAANFDCAWTATSQDYDRKTLVELSKLSHGKNPEWAQPLIGEGWFELTVGKFSLSEPVPIIEAKMFGGNSYWFRDLRVDYVELRPVDPTTPVAESYPEIKMESDPDILEAYRANHGVYEPIEREEEDQHVEYDVDFEVEEEDEYEEEEDDE